MAWLTGWGRRKKQTIIGSDDAQTNYQKKMTVHKESGSDDASNVYCGGNCRDDFGDIRWTEDNGTTPMDYWIEKLVSGDYAVFWVEIPSIPASPSTVDVYMYYDKSDATSQSNGDNTFIFFDSFERAAVANSKWDSVSDATTSITQAKFGSKSCRLGETAEAKVMRSLGGNEDSLTLWIYRTAGRSTYPMMQGDGSYSSYINIDSGDVLRYYVTSWNTIMTGFPQDEWVKLEVRYNWIAHTFDVWVNDEEKATNCGMREVAYNEDEWQFEEDGTGTYTYVDGTIIRKYVVPEPTWGSWGGEETPTPPPTEDGILAQIS